MNGVDLCNAVKQVQPDLPVVVMTAYAHDELCEKGLKEGAISVIQKPFDVDKRFIILTTICTEENSD